jgi:hypothetical protein
MASISSLSSAQSSVASQLRLQQAERNAEQAEANARALQAQAREAQQVASDAQANARSVSAQASQAEGNARDARLSLAVVRNGSQVEAQLTDTVSQLSKSFTAPQAFVPVRAVASPVVNTQGQVTGTVINTTA